jgi:hypothetical protein
MQASAMKACFQIAECSLSYAKVIKKRENEQKKDDFFAVFPLLSFYNFLMTLMTVTVNDRNMKK